MSTSPPSGPPPGQLRAEVERRSAVVLVLLSRQPRWLLALGPVLLLAGTVALPLVLATLCLMVLLALLGWLSFLSWPALDSRGRALRGLVVVVLVLLWTQPLHR